MESVKANLLYKRKKNSSIVSFFIILFCLMGFFDTQYTGIEIFGFNMSIFRILCLLIGIYLLFKIGKNYNSLTENCTKSYLLWISIWIAVSTIQLPFSHNIISSLKSIFLLVIYFIFTVFCRLKLNKKNIHEYIGILVSCLFLSIGILALFETFTGNYLFKIDIGSYSYARNLLNTYMPIVVFDNTNNLAFFCIVVLPVIYTAKQYSKSKVLSGFYTSIILFDFFVILLTDSRAGALAALLFISTIFLFKLKSSLRKNIIIIIVLLGVVLTFFLLVFFRSLIFDQGSNGIRLNLLVSGFVILLKSAWLGVGEGNIEASLIPFQNVGGVYALHNWFMEVLVAGGIIVFIGYVVSYVKLFKTLNSISQNASSKRTRQAAIGYLAFLIAFISASIGPSNVFQLDFMWVTFAIMLAFINFSYPKLRGRVINANTELHTQYSFRCIKNYNPNGVKVCR